MEVLSQGKLLAFSGIRVELEWGDKPCPTSPHSSLGLTVGNSREEEEETGQDSKYPLSSGERGPSWNVYSVTTAEPVLATLSERAGSPAGWHAASAGQERTCLS